MTFLSLTERKVSHVLEDMATMKRIAESEGIGACPSCNSTEAHIYVGMDFDDYHVKCKSCRMGGPHDDSMSLALAKWNRLSGAGKLNKVQETVEPVKTGLPRVF